MSEASLRGKVDFLLEMYDYEGVDLAFIDNIVRNYLPKLEQKITTLSQNIETP